MGNLSRGTAVLSKVQVTPVEPIRWPKKLISPEVGLTADRPRVSLKRQAPVVYTWQYFSKHILYWQGQGQGQGTALPPGGSGPAFSTGQFSHTQVLVPGLKPSDSIGHIFLLGMKDNSPIFEPFLLSILQNCM